jgi:hypothetical protein
MEDEIDIARRAVWAGYVEIRHRSVNELDRGNHFAAWQEPDLFTTEIRAAFRSLR